MKFLCPPQFFTARAVVVQYCTSCGRAVYACSSVCLSDTSQCCVKTAKHASTHTHTHPFNGPLSGTTRVSQYQKGKTNLDLVKQETVSGSGIGWTICKSAPRSRQITTRTPHRSVFYRPDALPAAQPTASKH